MTEEEEMKKGALLTALAAVALASCDGGAVAQKPVVRTIACKDYAMKVVEIAGQLGAHVDITLKSGWILSVKDPNDKHAPTSETHVVCNGDTGELREVYTHTGEVDRSERYDRPPKSPPAAVWVWKLRRLESILFSAAVAALPSGGEVQTFSRWDRQPPIEAHLYPVWRTDALRNEPGWDH